MRKIFLLTITLSSFLLFQIQPIVGKITLPFFGGNAAVWTTCMFFFQTFLLIGYYYSHKISKLSISNQVVTHIGLVIISLIFLPISVEMFNLDVGKDSPVIDIFATLLFSISIPYLLLSTSVPLLQRWFSILKPHNTTNNYVFYSFSNTGALIGLLTYPFIFEPYLTIKYQSALWSLSYIIYMLLICYTGFTLYKKRDELKIIKDNAANEVSPSFYKQLYWIGLSSTGVILLLSVTSASTQNISPVPFIWILYLSIYLLTFIVSFSTIKIYNRWLTGIFFLLCSLASLFLYNTSAIFDIYSQIILYSITLGAGCMICHSELANLKPSENQLTTYYLNISIGGFIGGLCVSVISPNLFNEYLEFPIGLLLVMLLFLIGSLISAKSLNDASKSSFMIRWAKEVFWITGIIIFAIFFLYINTLYKKTDVLNSRNFYGTLSVKDNNINDISERILVDGTTSHGSQYLDETMKMIPTSYYSQDSGVGVLLSEFKKYNDLKMAVIGLGAGTLAAYGDVGDEISFYELNPSVKYIAENYFTYLSDSKAAIDIKIGDGRLSLLERPDYEDVFNIIVLDAFSGDSIPQHLLTLEAFKLYWKNLEHNGVIALHISNSHIDLLPVVKAITRKLDKSLLYFSKVSTASAIESADWIVMTSNEEVLGNTLLNIRADQRKLLRVKEILWTDDFSSLFHVIK